MHDKCEQSLNSNVYDCVLHTSMGIFFISIELDIPMANLKSKYACLS